MKWVQNILEGITDSPAVGNRVLVMGSEHSGRVSDSPAVGNRVHVTQEEEQTCFEFQNTKITNSEFFAKGFPKCDKHITK